MSRMSPLVRVDVPAVRERRTIISATPTTIPETVRAVLPFRLLRLREAMLSDDTLDHLDPFRDRYMRSERRVQNAIRMGSTS